MNVTGTLNNAGDTLTLNNATGPWQLDGGTISDGTIALSDSTLLVLTSNGSNGLSGVTVNGDLDLSATSARLRISNGLTLNGTAHLSGSGAAMSFDGTQSFSSGTIAFEGTTGSTRHVTIEGTATLTLGAGATIRGGLGAVGSQFFVGGSNALINQGTISADVSGESLTLLSSSFTNTGTLEAKSGGTLSVSNLAAHAGTIRAGVGSTVTINGAFTQTSAGSMEIDVAGTAASQFGKVSVTNAAALDGTLDMSFVNAFDPDVATSVPVLTFGSSSGTFSSVTSTGLSAGKAVQAAYNSGDVTIVVAAALQAGGRASDEGRGSRVESDELTAATLADFVTASLSRLVPRSRVGLVSDIEFIVTDLPNNLLGLAAGHVIWIDQDAAGFGWFVDSTPNADDEFGLNSHEFSYGEAASRRMDLLTVLAHELGHLLGFEHDTDPGHLMSDTLAPGTRLLPIGAVTDIDGAFSGIDFL